MQIPTFDFRNNRNKGIVVIVFSISLLFAILRGREQSTLLAILIVMIGIGFYMNDFDNNSKPTNLEPHAKLDIEKELKERMSRNDRAAIPSESYAIKSFPKIGLRYLKDNETLLQIADNILYLKVYDRARYQDMLLLMDRMQKTYVYTLVGRLPCEHGISLFMDIRELIRQKMYSFYVIVPLKTLHMYGLDPHGELERSIRSFTSLTRRMIRILENYARRECKAPYVQPTVPLSHDPNASVNMLP